jgi:O-antigen/teichoic acid export membrane protein
MLLRTVQALIQEMRARKALMKNCVYMLAFRALQVLAALGAYYFIVRALSKDNFGEYHYILSVVNIVSIVSLKDMNNAVMQSIARGFLGTYRKSIFIALASNSVGSMALFAFSGWHFCHDEFELATGFLIAAVFFPFVHGLLQWHSIQIGKEDFIKNLTHKGGELFLMYGLIIAGVILMPGTLLIPLLFTLLIPALHNGFMTIISYRSVPNDSPVEDGSITYGVKTTIYSAANIISMHLDKLLLLFFLSPAAVASFVAADRIAELFRNITTDISVILSPKFAKYDHYTRQLDQYLKLFVFTFGVATIAFAFTLLPPLMLFLFSDNYADAIPYAQALLCSVTIGNMATLRFRFIRSKIDTKSHRTVLISTSLARILTSLILIPLFGVAGAVASAFLYRIYMTVVVNIMIKKNYPLDGVR